MGELMSSSPSKKFREELISYATRGGDIDGLYVVIKNHGQVLEEFDKIQFVDTPLHAAAASGEVTLAMEIINLMPSFGKKLNPDGLSPLHLALIARHRTTALALVRFDKQLVRVKGKDGCTPLHYAAFNCTDDEVDLDILASFLMECPDSINDLNNKFQSVVHLVMRSRSCKGTTVVLNWLTRIAREPILGWKDDCGNTALHIAAQHDCVHGVEQMVKMAKINKRNLQGKTPLDIAEHRRPNNNQNIIAIAIDEDFTNNKKIIDVLRSAGARKGDELREKESVVEYLLSETNLLEALLRGFCFQLKDLTLEMRNVVLVVAVLIATATYQAVLQPPGGVYQPDNDNKNNTTTNSTTTAHIATWSSYGDNQHLDSLSSSKMGKMVMPKKEYDQFMPTNTMAFSLSVVMIIYVLHGRPYNIILHGCLIFLAFSYLYAMRSISESSLVSQLTFIFAWYFIAAAFAIKMVYYLLKALFEDVWWLPRCAVTVSNRTYLFKCGPASKVLTFLRRLRRQCKLILPTGKYV